MSQYDFGIIDTNETDGSELAVLLQNFRDAIYSMHSGASRPSYVKTGMLWRKEVSSTSHEVYFYDGANDILVGKVNPTAHTWTPYRLGAAIQEVATLVIGEGLEKASTDLKLKTPVAVEHGGTGAADAAQARSNLGLANTAKTDQANTFTETQTFEGSAMVLDTQGSGFVISRGNANGTLHVAGGTGQGDGGNILLRDGTAGNDIRFRQDTNVRVVIAAGVQVGSPTGGDRGVGTLNVQNGLFLNGTPLMAQSLGNPGYVKFANGLLIQWGSGTYSSRQEITLPVAYTSFPFAWVAGDQNQAGRQTNAWVGPSGSGLTSIRVAGGNMSWMTIGT